MNAKHDSESGLPSNVQVVTIGGVIGCGTAYHLTKPGRRDIVILESKQLIWNYLPAAHVHV